MPYNEGAFLTKPNLTQINDAKISKYKYIFYVYVAVNIDLAVQIDPMILYWLVWLG